MLVRDSKVSVDLFRFSKLKLDDGAHHYFVLLLSWGIPLNDQQKYLQRFGCFWWRCKLSQGQDRTCINHMYVFWMCLVKSTRS